MPMISLLLSPLARCSVALRILFTLSLLAAGLSASAADEPDAGGTFNAPGYPQRTLPPGAQGNGANGSNLPNAQNRGANGQGPNGNTNNGTGTGAGAYPRNGRDLGDSFPRRIEPPPPPKPNEFQRFVEGATGRLLPIFGASFFADAADT
ncbi:MAG: hypothetical protein ABIZ18_13565, partial [Caldimonas sp.]